eukprot:COSAG06_NODE_3969_length_4708_cov_2.553699_5_plen_215_part_00
MATAAAAQSSSQLGPLCARIVAAVIPGAKYTPPQLGTMAEYSPSRRQRVGASNRSAQHNSPWADDEWAEDDEEESESKFSLCGLSLRDQEDVATAISVPRSGRVIVQLAGFMAGLDAALLWAALPLAVVSLAGESDLGLASVGVFVGLIAAAHSLGQLLGSWVVWHPQYSLGRLKPLSSLLLGQIGLVVSFAALAVSTQLLWVGCVRLVRLVPQ